MSLRLFLNPQPLTIPKMLNEKGVLIFVSCVRYVFAGIYFILIIVFLYLSQAS